MLTLRVFVEEHLHGAGDLVKFAIQKYLRAVADSHQLKLGSFELVMAPAHKGGNFDFVGLTLKNLDDAVRIHLALSYTKIPRGDIPPLLVTPFYRLRESVLMNMSDHNINDASRLAERVNVQWAKRPVRRALHGKVRA